jgi:hypothetical protein
LFPAPPACRSGQEIVGLSQTYFAAQTRRQEYTDVGRALEYLSESRKRRYQHRELADYNTKLATAPQ